MSVFGWIEIALGTLMALSSLYLLVTGRNYPGLLGRSMFKEDRERVRTRGPAHWRLMGATYVAFGCFWLCAGSFYVSRSPITLVFAVPFVAATVSGFIVLLRRAGPPRDLRRRLTIVFLVLGATFIASAAVYAVLLLLRHHR